ncbi:MAG: hypothetical protein HY700_17675 [Gemmatimonadetes bacterium]|nr:hypothetical protein [Gemmatimonadota bacterium]
MAVLSVFGSLFMPQPWLALIPGALFLGLYRLSRRRLAAAAAVAWLLYAPYEYAMHRRWLCSGECNIRVDLLLLYPLLIVLSLAAVVVLARSLLPRREGG